ncbi:unnamed protein product [Allacma fusca]|uniref:Uncharacterized protein n=1 Tax=Allacma fusca TaxID=39272 RepID=A0A8J2P9H0_9HEXA|nr:unnamed protein product [Allacma fusca]
MEQIRFELRKRVELTTQYWLYGYACRLHLSFQLSFFSSVLCYWGWETLEPPKTFSHGISSCNLTETG